jgi:hypothetical protein
LFLIGLNPTRIGAALNGDAGAAVDGSGNLYIADSGNNVIREVTSSTGIITTLVCNGTVGLEAMEDL